MAQDKRAAQILKGIFGPHVYDSEITKGLIGPVSDQLEVTDDRIYYVSPFGSDVNLGVAPSMPLGTLQGAVNKAARANSGGYSITVLMADGTYSGGVTLPAGDSNSGLLKLSGNVTTPANTLITNSTSGKPAISYAPYARWALANVRLTSVSPANHQIAIGRFATVSPYGDFHSKPGVCILDNVVFGPSAAQSIYIFGEGSQLYCTTQLTIELQANVNWLSLFNGASCDFRGCVISLTGTGSVGNAARTTGFVNVFEGSRILSAATFNLSGTTGPVGGRRYTAALNAIVETFGGGTAHFPGDAVGTTATGAQASEN